MFNLCDHFHWLKKTIVRVPPVIFSLLIICLSSSLLSASMWRVLCFVAVCRSVWLWLFLKTVYETHVCVVLLFLLLFCHFFCVWCVEGGRRRRVYVQRVRPHTQRHTTTATHTHDDDDDDNDNDTQRLTTHQTTTPTNQPAAQCASTRENSPGPDTARIDRLMAVSKVPVHCTLAGHQFVKFCKLFDLMQL